MSQTPSARYLIEFAKELKARKSLPQNIELSTIGSVIMASVFDQISAAVITDEVTTGMDVDPDIAVLKGLVEKIERQAFLYGHRDGHFACQTDSSDGFAAFPKNIRNSQKQVRDNALHEAIERYVWATWWDDKNIGHDIEVISTPDLSSQAGKLLNELSANIQAKSIYRICPKIANADDFCVVIYFLFLKSVGVISGGACGSKQDQEITNFRAVSELVRHGLSIKKIKEQNIKTNTFYENRLSYFGLSDEGTALARDRMQCQGTQAVELPPLKIDTAIPHLFSDLVTVHRCYFENQPPFIGGELERLCL